MTIALTSEQVAVRAAYLIGMSEDDRAERRNFLGASDANIIVGGDKERIYRLWQEKTGEAEPEDLSNNLPVQMGTFTEDLNLYWFERQTGKRVYSRKEKVVHPTLPFIRASLDGCTTHPENDMAAVIDAKHVSAFNFEAEDCLAKYSPQLAVQMACKGYEWGMLSIFSGTTTWVWAATQRDVIYEARVLAAMKDFWAAVQSKTPPPIPASMMPAMPIDQMRKVDMSRHNEWSAHEADYLAHEESAKKFDAAKGGMKKLVDGDVREATGKLLTIRRSKDGSLRFSKTK
jgi:predicted phage-related endonuclease